jgi:hypothetical protein
MQPDTRRVRFTRRFRNPRVYAEAGDVKELPAGEVARLKSEYPGLTENVEPEPAGEQEDEEAAPPKKKRKTRKKRGPRGKNKMITGGRDK